MKLSYLIICLLLCVPGLSQKKYNEKKMLADFKVLINENKNLKDQLLWNGCYDLTNDSLGYTAPVFFFQNGLVAMSFVRVYGHLWMGKTIGDPNSVKKYRDEFDWGTYKISNDTIIAMFFYNYSEASSMLFSDFRPAYYTGLIRDVNYIADWHALPPFKFNKGIDSLSCDMVFKPLKEKALMDSSKAWVLKYKR